MTESVAWGQSELIEATVVPGSHSPSVVRIGARVEVERDSTTGRLIVTRGAGALLVGFVTDASLAVLAELIDQRGRLRGCITGTRVASVERTIYVRLDDIPK